ncbi:DUF5659 domain-containing protein [Bacillus smithii]|uniref:DUF5659 domain-containing protein n=1 Tax=Bacillus smithii TaxID=1479 RepID=UPI002E1BEEEF|nr:DUF5659 domain-containing protein [Bacillus smithii]MED4928960.1 DUF5659 domain-containing protein [Bacillus smithii]
MEKEHVMVFKPKIARHLLKKGFQIVDIKPYKENPDKTIFIFKRSKEVLNAIYSIK